MDKWYQKLALGLTLVQPLDPYLLINQINQFTLLFINASFSKP